MSHERGTIIFMIFIPPPQLMCFTMHVSKTKLTFKALNYQAKCRIKSCMQFKKTQALPRKHGIFFMHKNSPKLYGFSTVANLYILCWNSFVWHIFNILYTFYLDYRNIIISTNFLHHFITFEFFTTVFSWYCMNLTFCMNLNQLSRKCLI